MFSQECSIAIGGRVMLLKSIDKCIYCGIANVPLTDEHVIPYSLGGTWVLPNASCKNCADSTSRAERDISRETYLPLRTKAKFPTYRKNRRPKAFEAILVTDSGERIKAEIPIDLYPVIYPVLRLPPPEILTTSVLASHKDKASIEIGLDYSDLLSFFEKYPSINSLELSTKLRIDSFFRTLAKIAHSFVIGKLGDVGYEQLLPPIILGDTSQASYLIGGGVEATGSRTSTQGDGLDLIIDQNGYIIVNIAILGQRVPIYSAVAGRVIDWNLFMTNTAHRVNEEAPEFCPTLKTRFGFNFDWTIEIIRYLRIIVEQNFPHAKQSWPLINGFSFDAYSLPPRHALLVMKNSNSQTPAGPTGHLKMPATNYPCLPPRSQDLFLWRQWLSDNLGVGEDEWPIILPVHDSGKCNVDDDYRLFSDEDKRFWEAQWQNLIYEQERYTRRSIGRL